MKSVRILSRMLALPAAFFVASCASVPASPKVPLQPVRTLTAVRSSQANSSVWSSDAFQVTFRAVGNRWKGAGKAPSSYTIRHKDPAGKIQTIRTESFFPREFIEAQSDSLQRDIDTLTDKEQRHLLIEERVPNDAAEWYSHTLVTVADDGSLSARYLNLPFDPATAAQGVGAAHAIELTSTTLTWQYPGSGSTVVLPLDRLPVQNRPNSGP